VVYGKTADAADLKISNQPVTFESNRNHPIEFESSLEASQVPSKYGIGVAGYSVWVLNLEINLLHDVHISCFCFVIGYFLIFVGYIF